MTFANIKDDIRGNLDDAGVTFYSNDDLTESLQDAYDDVVFQTQCIIKKQSLNFPVGPYLDLSEYIEDFMGVCAIFNQNTNRFLRDDLTLRDFDNLRIDWELWNGTPDFWAPATFNIIAISPAYLSKMSGLDIYYFAKAPFVIDTATPLISVDFLDLLEDYSTADLLEQAEEFTKASRHWKTYIERIPDYRERTKKLAKRDILLKI